MAATPKLQTIDVTPVAKAISVGQKQTFTATGTFSDGTKQTLGPGLANMSLGDEFTCALLTSRGVECWGDNYYGQLGDGKTGYQTVYPHAVKGIATATSLTLGEAHACALLATGAVRCWGLNFLGELGEGSNTDSNVPMSVIGISTATALGAGWQHSCARLTGGAIECWGYNYSGQLGNGTYVDSNVPVAVTGISTATALALGNYHSCALLADGAVRCWGDNSRGQLGDGTTTTRNAPVTVSGIGAAIAIAAGGSHTCALLVSGAVQCWGSGVHGQLGDGFNTDSHVPVQVAGISTAIAIAAGGQSGNGNLPEYTCAVLRSGAVQCWGGNEVGQLGNGTTTDSNLPVAVQGIHGPTRLAAGASHACALFSGGMMMCWGADLRGELGNRQKTTSPTSLPVTVVGTPGVAWKSSNATKATINDRGVATGRAIGNTTITATTAGFINDNVVLTVK